MEPAKAVADFGAAATAWAGSIFGLLLSIGNSAITLFMFLFFLSKIGQLDIARPFA